MEREEKPEFNQTLLDLKHLEVENREKSSAVYSTELSFDRRVSSSDSWEVYTRIVTTWKFFFNKPGKAHQQTSKCMLQLCKNKQCLKILLEIFSLFCSYTKSTGQCSLLKRLIHLLFFTCSKQLTLYLIIKRKRKKEVTERWSLAWQIYSPFEI